MLKSEHNLMVIENFIDYFTTNEKERHILKAVAQRYVEEDHVDGKECEDDNIFTTDDMRKSFVAGETFEVDTYKLDMDEVSELTEPDFGEWMENTYNVKVG